MIDIEKIAVKSGFCLHKTKHGSNILIANPEKELFDGYFSVEDELQAYTNEVIEMCAKECDGDITDPMRTMYAEAIRTLKVKG